MTGKRPPGPLDPVIYNKLALLEADAGHRQPSRIYKSGSQDPLSYGGVMAGQSLRVDSMLMNCLLYQQESESLQPMEKGCDHAMRNLLLAPKKRAGHVEHCNPLQQATQCPAHLGMEGPEPPACAPLGAPKRTYWSPVCYVDPGYGPPSCLALGTSGAESGTKRPLHMDCTAAAPLLRQGKHLCSLDSLPIQSQHLEAAFLSLPQTEAPGMESVLNLSSYQVALDKSCAVRSALLLEQAPSHYPEALQEQPLLCPPVYPPPEKPNKAVLSLQSPSPYFNSRGNGLPGSCPQQQTACGTCVPSSTLEGCAYPTGPIQVSSPGLKAETATSHEPASPPTPKRLLDFISQTPGFAFAPQDIESLYGPALGAAEMSPAQDALPGELGANQHSTFQLKCQSPGSGGPSPNAGSQRQASCPVSHPGKAEKPRQDSEYEKWFCSKEETRPSCGWDESPVVIPDSPVPQAPPGPGQPLLSPREHPQGLRQTTGTAPPSPPMPIIIKVFSLAPYKDYLDNCSEMEPDLPLPKDLTLGSICSLVPCPAADSGAFGELSSEAEHKDGHGEEREVSPLPPCGESPVEPATDASGQSPPKEEAALGVSLNRQLVEPSRGALSQRLPTEPVAETSQAEKEAQPRLPASPPLAPTMVETLPRPSLHSSVAFMFHKFKTLWPAPPSTADPVCAPAPAQTARLQFLTQPLQVTCFNVTLVEPVALPEPISPAPTLASEPVPTVSEASRGPEAAPTCMRSPGQHFTGLHTSLCDTISDSVAHTSPEKLREWLEEAEQSPPLSLPPSSPLVRGQSRPRVTEGRARGTWLSRVGVKGLLAELLAQLETFLLTHKCPFPHVVRAGAIFVPIYLVKGKLFPRLPGSSVDHVLQEHRVELRPTTLSEERALRDCAFHSRTSSMLKLLPLRKLPDIYPDLLGLQWRDCLRRQLREHNRQIPQAKAEAAASEGSRVREEVSLVPANLESWSSKAKKRKKGTPGPRSEGSAMEPAPGGASAANPSAEAEDQSPRGLPGPLLPARFRHLFQAA